MADQRARQRHALLLPARQHGRPLRRLVGQPDLGKRGFRPSRARRPHLRAGAEADLHIRQHARPGQQPRLLEHHPHVRRCLRALLLELEAAGVVAVEAGDQPQQRALAAAAAADDGDELAGRNAQVDAAQHLVVAERLAQAADVQRYALDRIARPRSGRSSGPRTSSGSAVREWVAQAQRRAYRAAMVHLLNVSGMPDARTASAVRAAARCCRRACRAARRSGCSARRRRPA